MQVQYLALSNLIKKSILVSLMGFLYHLACRPKAFETIRRVIAAQTPYWSCLAGLDTKLPKSLEDLIKFRTPAESEKKNLSSYIPNQYGNYVSSPYVETVSRSVSKGRDESAHTIDSKYGQAKAAPKAENMSQLSSRLEATKLANSTDYKPFEYGISCGNSGYVTSFSNSWSGGQCEVTAAPKQSLSAEERNKREEKPNAGDGKS